MNDLFILVVIVVLINVDDMVQPYTATQSFTLNKIANPDNEVL